MFPRKIIVGFLWKFALVYGLLIVPWPGLNAVYGRVFRSVGNLVFSRETGRRLLRFEEVPAASRRLLDSRILLANREAVGENGNIPAKYLELDSRAIGWIPAALFIALAFASPISWRRRRRVLWSGLLIVHAFIAFSLAVYVWNRSTDLGLLTMSRVMKSLTEGLEETLINQMGASFVVPVLIWILVTVPFPNLVPRPTVGCAGPAQEMSGG